MADRSVSVSLANGGQVEVTDPDQVVGVASCALVRDAGGQIRITDHADADQLRAAIARKLAPAAPPPVLVPDPSTPAEVAGSVLESLDRAPTGEE